MSAAVVLTYNITARYITEKTPAIIAEIAAPDSMVCKSPTDKMRSARSPLVNVRKTSVGIRKQRSNIPPSARLAMRVSARSRRFETTYPHAAAVRVVPRRMQPRKTSPILFPLGKTLATRTPVAIGIARLTREPRPEITNARMKSRSDPWITKRKNFGRVDWWFESVG